MHWSRPVHVLACLAMFAAAASVRAGQGGGQAPGQSQEAISVRDTGKGAALLAEARKALGGEDRLKAVQRLELRGTVRRGAAQQNINLEGDLEIFIELPNKFRRNESLSIGGAGQAVDRVEVMNGTEVWEETKFAANLGGGGDGGDFGGGFRGFPGGGRQGQPGGDGRGLPAGVDQAQIAERIRQAQLRTRQTEFARVLLALLAVSEAPVAWIGTAKAPEGTADVLEITTADNTQTRIFLESNTHLPLMMSWVGFPQDPIATLVGQRGGRGRGGRGGEAQGRQGGQPGQPQGQQAGRQGQGGDARGGRGGRGNFQPVTLQMFLADYKTVNGIRFPHLVTRGAAGEITEEWIVKNYRLNPNFRANTFTK